MHFHSKYLTGIHDKMDQKTPPNFDEIKENCEKASHCRDKLHPTQHPGCFSVSLPSDTSLHFKSKASRRRTSSPQLLNHIQVVLSGRVATWCSCYSPPSLRLLWTPLMSYKKLKPLSILFSAYKACGARQKLQTKGKTHPAPPLQPQSRTSHRKWLNWCQL